MKVVAGMSLGGVSASGVTAGTVTLGDADVTTVLHAAAGLSKALLKAGAGQLGAAVLGAMIGEAQAKRDARIPVGTLARVRVGSSRDFLGICEDSHVTFLCDGQRFEVPLDRIHMIRAGGTLFSARFRYVVELVDGSIYRPDELLNEEFTFASLAGRQSLFPKTKSVDTVTRHEEQRTRGPVIFRQAREEEVRFVEVKEQVERVARRRFVLEGVTPVDVSRLAARLEYAIQNNLHSIVGTLGAPMLHAYFEP